MLVTLDLSRWPTQGVGQRAQNGTGLRRVPLSTMEPSTDAEAFAGRTALVTGASRGIGRPVAVEFARLGAHVAVHYNTNRAAADETVGMLAGTGHVAVAADLADAAAVQALVADVVARFGAIDILVNNAARYDP